jgi:small-conductance mechanosensitive channel
MLQKLFIFFLLAFPAFSQEAPVAEGPLLSDKAVSQVEAAANSMVNDLAHTNIFIRFGISLAIVIITLLLARQTKNLFNKIRAKIAARGTETIKPIVIRKFTLLETKQILNVIYFLLRIIKYFFYIMEAYLALMVVFRLFETTRGIAARLLGYVLTPLKNTGVAIINYIPNLITIIITLLVARYILRAIRFFTGQIEKRKLVIPGFYADWARPTFNILRILLYAFTLVIIYPMLPSSGSNVFQGVSVFVGILFSLGSSSVISNLVAGVVVTYMRPFKIGDRIKIGEVVGFVVEKSATVTRLRTHKNEYITFPNSTILSSNITNYNFASGEGRDGGLILYATISFGYGTPWQTIHAILIDAALKTQYVQHNPKPYVLQTSLDDFYAYYEINVYIKEVAKIPSIYSELNKNIQNGFHEAGLDMTATHFRTLLPPAEAKIVEEGAGLPVGLGGLPAGVKGAAPPAGQGEAQP